MEDFVDFDNAKKLKEKGFREKVNAYYGKHENIFEVHPSLDMNDNDYRCSAPTIEQVLKWLRKEKKIYVSVEVEREDWFEYKIVQTIKNTRCNGTKVYETYPEAILSGIEYVLNNLI
jgi:hypothetical protein